MKLNWTHGAALLACVAMSGCGMIGGGSKAPKGQVVATVNGEEITVTELNRELGGASAADATQRKALEQAALQSIITRKLLAQAAKEEKLDKTPAFAQQEMQAKEAMLVGAMQRKVAATVANPSRVDAEKFVAEHPHMFADRRVMVVDQIVVGKFSPELMKQFEPLTTLEQVEAVLGRENLDFQRTTTVLDTLNAPEGLTETLMKLPAGEIFVFPRGNAVFVNQIRESRTLPFTGERAINYATAGLKQMRTQEAVGRQIESIRKSAEGKITYNDKYKPDPAKPVAKPATPAAPAPAPNT
ncbi:EpsD family peptidyl-prolyl cis-trans isomerase [Phenylobacterium haematophilum]|jgi:EpsD family peptidyl-prolyl cis-trans isomerase|uniref:EpsD family peptidyl-prolyl cis-trans isomerase n=1 Tax=Phenylobacterium haematophilum TaxID=98513 RepID=A0A839ZWS7_9CAUL|nr:SurA N-terminal domain-containing protein [Phenylobacterium haematophilum]MBB3890494.1 EpsD family peptidyl-prolyl cis-trans isomerase [Phenylobacterium haematophilum]